MPDSVVFHFPVSAEDRVRLRELIARYREILERPTDDPETAWLLGPIRYPQDPWDSGTRFTLEDFALHKSAYTDRLLRNLAEADANSPVVDVPPASVVSWKAALADLIRVAHRNEDAESQEWLAKLLTEIVRLTDWGR